MRDNARRLEQDDEVKELLAQKRALIELNRERKQARRAAVELGEISESMIGLRIGIGIAGLESFCFGVIRFARRRITS